MNLYNSRNNTLPYNATHATVRSLIPPNENYNNSQKGLDVVERDSRKYQGDGF